MTLRPTATIHLSNIADNWRTLSALTPGARTAAVVKANAYGHGIEQVGDALNDAGCEIFFVAYTFEGLALRRAIGPHAMIFVLNGPDFSEGPDYARAGLTAVINTAQQYRAWVMWRVDGHKVPYALHFDTGMNRLGLSPDDVAELAEATAAAPPILLMSHLIDSETPGHTLPGHTAPLIQEQAEALSAISQAFPGVPLSLSNSGGVRLGPDYAHAVTRPGIALYGGGSGAGTPDLKPGLTLTAPILSLHTAHAGETVGYDATHTFSADTPLATVALGYADGWLRSGSNAAIGYIDGAPCPVVGRVSMDLTTIDVSKAHRALNVGDSVEFLGKTADLEAQAQRAGTIGYELLTGISDRVERIYE